MSLLSKLPRYTLSRFLTCRPLLGATLVLWGLLLATCPGAAQGLRPRALPARTPWVTAAALGPALPVGPVRGPASSGFDLTTTLEYSFRQPQGLWVRGTLDAIQFSATEQLTGPGYAYTLSVNNSVTSLLLDAGYRRAFGRLVPYVFVGAGGSYFSSSQLQGEQAGQAQHLGAASGYGAAVRAGAGLEYRLYRARLIPYVELTGLALPDRPVGGEPLRLLTPLIGLKFPL